MADPIAIGIVGAGAIVRARHMPGLGKIDGVSVVAVCNRRLELARKFAADYQVPHVVENWPDLVARDDIDVVWIGATPNLHRDVTVAALAAGKHVFCQARMARNLAEAIDMRTAAAAHPALVTMICPPPMGMPGDRVMRRLLGPQCYVGQIRHVHLRNLSAACLDPDAELHWRMDRSVSGQNAFALGIYIEVLNRWIGPAARVHAVHRTWTGTRRHGETGQVVPVEIPESLSIVAELDRGGVGLYELNGVSAHAPADRLEIYGTEGTIHYHFDAAGEERILAARRDDAHLVEVPIGAAERRRWTVEADFIDAVRTGDQSAIEPNFDDGVQYMAFIDAAYRSASSQRAVEVRRTDV